MPHRSREIEELLRPFLLDPEDFYWARISWEFFESLNRDLSERDFLYLLLNNNIEREPLEKYVHSIPVENWQIIITNSRSTRCGEQSSPSFSQDFFLRHYDYIVSIGLERRLAENSDLKEDFFTQVIKKKSQLVIDLCDRRNLSEEFCFWLFEKNFIPREGMACLCYNSILTTEFYRKHWKRFHKKPFVLRLLRNKKLTPEFLFECFTHFRAMYPRFRLSEEQLNELAYAAELLFNNEAFPWAWIMHPNIRKYLTIKESVFFSHHDVPEWLVQKQLSNLNNDAIFDAILRNKKIRFSGEMAETFAQMSASRGGGYLLKIREDIPLEIKEKYIPGIMKYEYRPALTESLLWGFDNHEGDIETYYQLISSEDSKKVNYPIYRACRGPFFTEAHAQFFIDKAWNTDYHKELAHIFLGEMDAMKNVSWEFFDRNYEFFVDTRDWDSYFSRSGKFPVLFFRKHPSALCHRIVENPFTYQIQAETGFLTERTVYNAQMAIREISSPEEQDNLVNTVLGMIRSLL